MATTYDFDGFMAAFNLWFSKQAPEDWRYGQALFNALAQHRPDIAESLRGTRLDPFYREMSEIKQETWNRIAERW